MLSKLRAWWRRKFHRAPQHPAVTLRKYQEALYETTYRQHEEWRKMMCENNKFYEQEMKK